MRYSELKRWLRKQGCEKQREGGKHEVWVNPANGQTTYLGRHDSEEVANGTLNAIKKDLGLKGEK